MRKMDALIFRFDKTPWVMRELNMARMTVSVVERRFEDTDMRRYIDLIMLSYGSTTESIKFLADVYICYERASLEDERLRSIWVSLRGRYARNIKYNLIDLLHKKATLSKEDLRSTIAKVNVIIYGENLGTVADMINNMITVIESDPTSSEHDVRFITSLSQAWKDVEDPLLDPCQCDACVGKRRRINKDALKAISECGDDDAIDAIVKAAMHINRCPRVLLRVGDNVARACDVIKANDPNILILALDPAIPSRRRSSMVTRFQSYDGEKVKMMILRRYSMTAQGTVGRVLRMGHRYLLDAVERYLIRARILVCTKTGEVGYNLHRHATSIFTTLFINDYQECVQFMGRVCRIAPDIKNPGEFNLCMPMYKYGLDEFFFLPEIQKQCDELSGDISQRPVPLIVQTTAKAKAKAKGKRTKKKVAVELTV